MHQFHIPPCMFCYRNSTHVPIYVTKWCIEGYGLIHCGSWGKGLLQLSFIYVIHVRDGWHTISRYLYAVCCLPLLSSVWVQFGRDRPLMTYGIYVSSLINFILNSKMLNNDVDAKFLYNERNRFSITCAGINPASICPNTEMSRKIMHYNDVIMEAIAYQITSLTIVYSIVYSDADQRKHQSSASLAFVWGIHRGPVNSPHKCQLRGKCSHLMTSSWRTDRSSSKR